MTPLDEGEVRIVTRPRPRYPSRPRTSGRPRPAAAAMKIRSCLLIACMAFVPLVAMFSHKIPREWRQAVQRLARGEGLPAWAASAADRPGPRRAAEPPAEAEVAPAAREISPSPDEDFAAVRAAVAEKLRGLGAVSFECGPLAGGGLHRCSCRVPADGSGTLQRVFQSSNPDPVVALRNLLGQVQFWKHRLAAAGADTGTQVR